MSLFELSDIAKAVVLAGLSFATGFAAKALLESVQAVPVNAQAEEESILDTDDETEVDVAGGSDVGKIAAQCGHATLGSYRRAERQHPDFVSSWKRHGQAKVVLKLKSEEQMDAVAARAEAMGLPWYIVEDAGRTQIAAGSRTVLGIGPAPIPAIDSITGRNGDIPLSLFHTPPVVCGASVTGTYIRVSLNAQMES